MGGLPENPVHSHRGDVIIKLRHHREKVLYYLDIFSGVAEGNGIGAVDGHQGGVEGLTLADQLRQFQNAHVQKDQLIPGGVSNDSVRRQAENLLEFDDRLLGGRSEDPVHRLNLRNSGVIAGDAVEHGLDAHHRLPPVAQPHRSSGVGAADTHDRSIVHDLDIVAIIVSQDGDGVGALLCHGLAAPLGETVAGGGGAVAKFGCQGLHKAGAPYVGIEDLIHHLADVLKNVAPFDEFLVVGRAGGDVEGVAAAGVIFGIYPVEGKRNDRQDVCPDSRRLPGGIDLAGGHILNVFREGNRHIFRSGAGGAQMHGDVLWDIGRYRCGRHGGTSLQILGWNIHDLPPGRRRGLLRQGNQLQLL